MNKRGFTLIELLGCIVILGLISLLAFPPMLNFLSSSQKKIDEAKEGVILSSARDYVNDNVGDYKRDLSLNKKIKTSELINKGYITNKEITQDDDLEDSWICVTVDEENRYSFIFKGECS
ncbi:MAG: type II secretion system protein [Bacilli bacterium]|nr:type II secretion system protein [Bacilli bacterium]